MIAAGELVPRAYRVSGLAHVIVFIAAIVAVLLKVAHKYIEYALARHLALEPIAFALSVGANLLVRSIAAVVVAIYK